MQITFLDIECSETSNLELNNYISLVKFLSVVELLI